MTKDGFVPGEQWTPDRAAAAVERMRELQESPEMKALMRAIADGAEGGGDPAAMAAELASSGPAEVAAFVPDAPSKAADAPLTIDPARVTYRRGGDEDVPRFAELIIAGDLPPIYIAEFVRGFVAADHDGLTIACGGLEMYGDCGVIRSVATDPRVRNSGVGAVLSQLLIEDARASGARDLYLFTMHAERFWRRLGFERLPIGEWKPAVHVNWQYEWVTSFPEAAADVIPMWMPL